MLFMETAIVAFEPEPETSKKPENPGKRSSPRITIDI
jgi:hypothetical protein